MYQLTQDYINQGCNGTNAYKFFKSEIKRMLRKDSKQLEDFGLQFEPGTTTVKNLDDPSELKQNKDKYNSKERHELYESLKHSLLLNNEQQMRFNSITNKVMNNHTVSRIHFELIHGAADTGKSVLASHI